MSIEQDIKLELLEIALKKPCHLGGAFSCVEILKTLYFDIMNIDPDNAYRDRFILSKGHGMYALYCVLKRKGFDISDISALCHHPEYNPKLGIEATTGSLGHGLSIGCGIAMASFLNKIKYDVYVLLGDGESQEGSVWEAAMFAAHHKLTNLIAITDINKFQALDETKNILDLEPLHKKWDSFGWGVTRVDGHNSVKLKKILSSLKRHRHNKPQMILAETVKGHGVSFMECNPLWHFRGLTQAEYEQAVSEIS